jgi:hypothetical protein
MGFLAKNTVEKACKKFRSMFDAVVEADAILIE